MTALVAVFLPRQSPVFAFECDGECSYQLFDTCVDVIVSEYGLMLVALNKHHPQKTDNHAKTQEIRIAQKAEQHIMVYRRVRA